MNIIFFDGGCSMCHWAVRWIATRDTAHKLYFAPLRGLTAKEKLYGYVLPDSIVYYEDGKVFFYSKACFKIAWQLGGVWATLGALSFLPDWLLFPANCIYRLIAKTRSTTSCDITPIPSNRFLP